MDQNELLQEKFKNFIESFAVDELKLEQNDQLKRFLHLLAETNLIHNLVSFKTFEELVFRHAADSLCALPIINKFIKEKNISKPAIVDVGSGGGFPAIPLKIFLPESSFLLVESVGKKCNFLKEASAALGFENFRVENIRAEEIGRAIDCREKFDFATSRALSGFNSNLEFISPFVKPGGLCIIYKSEKYKDELLNAENALKKLNLKLLEIFSYEIPLETETKKFNLLILEKTGHTQNIYPRRTGIPEKNPL